jgi:hypothetical protein
LVFYPKAHGSFHTSHGHIVKANTMLLFLVGSMISNLCCGLFLPCNQKFYQSHYLMLTTYLYRRVHSSHVESIIFSSHMLQPFSTSSFLFGIDHKGLLHQEHQYAHVSLLQPMQELLHAAN